MEDQSVWERLSDKGKEQAFQHLEEENLRLQTELKEAREKIERAKGLVDLARIPEIEPENKRQQWGINFKFLIEIGELVEDREMCESVTLEQTEEVILALMKRNVLPKAIAQEEK